MAKLTKAQRDMVIASDPDDVTGEEGVALELRGGRDWAVARSLVRIGLGAIGDACGPSYWNNSSGLALLRAVLADQEGAPILSAHDGGER